MKTNNQLSLFVILVGAILLIGCTQQPKKDIVKFGDYYFIGVLNVSCDIPKNLIEVINNLTWEKITPLTYKGNVCEAISPECTSEAYIFKSNKFSLKHRIHFMGSPDNTYYLTYLKTSYHCK